MGQVVALPAIELTLPNKRDNSSTSSNVQNNSGMMIKPKKVHNVLVRSGPT